MLINEITSSIYLYELEHMELMNFLDKYSHYNNWRNNQMVKAYIEVVGSYLYLDRIQGTELAIDWRTNNYRDDIGYMIINCPLSSLLQKVEVK